MSRDRFDVLERFEPLVGAPAPSFEAFLRRRDRRRRRQRIAAGAVGIAVFVAVVVLIATGGRVGPSTTPGGSAPSGSTGPAITPPDGRVGFVGLPPDGADPSSPEHGELVITYYGRPSFGVLQVLVYADGRVIWREEYGSNGADGIGTGFLERRLTPEGVELLRSEVISSGLFDRDHHFDAGLNKPGGDQHGLIWGEIRVNEGNRFVSVRWGGGTSATTPEEATALRRLNDLFLDPASVLPASAWEDPEAKAYVPSRYAICYRKAGSQHAEDVIEPSEVVEHLPTPAQDLLLGRHRTYKPDPGGASREVCSEVTTEDARLLEEILVDAGFERVWTGLTTNAPEYSVPAPAPIERAYVRFEPILPHGNWSLFPG